MREKGVIFPVRDPIGDPSGYGYVGRGGSWTDIDLSAPVAFRAFEYPSVRGEYAGLRVVSMLGMDMRRRPANPYRRAPGAPLHWGAASHDLEVALRSPGSVGVPAYGANSS